MVMQAAPRTYEELHTVILKNKKFVIALQTTTYR